MGGRDDEPAGAPGSDDPFAQLVDPDFVHSAGITEPSAAERARAARSADLRRRLAEEADQQDRQLKTDQRAARRARRRQKAPRVLGPALVVAGVAVVVFLLQGGASDGQLDVGDEASGPDTPSRPEGFPPVAADTSATPLGTPPAPPAEIGPYEFTQTQRSSDEPVAWDPCRPVRYVVNPAGAPPGTDALVQQAIDNTALATGLRFESAGTTDELWSKDREPYQPSRYGDRWAPALIAWSTEAEVPGLGGYIAGLGGAQSVTDSDGEGVYVSGGLVLDASDLGVMLNEPGGTEAVRAVIQHELGHVMGLDHVSDPRELMYTEGSPAQTTNWGPGDRRGLHELGSGACFPSV